MLSQSIADFTAPESFEISLVVEERVEIKEPILLHCADSAACFLHQTFGMKDREHFGVLFFDIRHRLTGHYIAHVGDRQRVIIEAYSIFVPALLANAHSVIVWHNHPSGDPAPSQDDIQATRRLTACGEFLGIQLVDHLVLGDPPKYYSIRTKERCV